MAKGRMRRNKQRKNIEQGGDQQYRTKPVPYELSFRENELFVRYYQMQGVVPDGEWEDFYKTLQTNLPATFRISGHRRQAKELMRIIQSEFFSKMVEVIIDGEKVAPPKCIAWYPDELAWQMNLTRKEIRASESLKQLHAFLITETESGNISRQEAVSMIPPLLLDIQPHHKILDMCAAPGSKTAQIIEYLHREDNNTIPSGYVVANDKDNNRCYFMVHQVKRLQSPNCMIINHDATLLPSFVCPSKTGDGKREFVKFDRILVDVPCSGDGTLRKNPELWTKWHPGLGINLHGLQCRILHRGLEMLAEGGRLVYSTCSMNPIENEAIVASTLVKCQGTVRLVDVSQQLPGLRYIKGLSSWKVVTRKEEVYGEMADVSHHHLGFVKDTMFPPSSDVIDRLNLHYCMRILPHHQDTGAFFVAVLEKTGHLPWMKGRVTQVNEEIAPKPPAKSPDSSVGNDLTVETRDNSTPVTPCEIQVNNVDDIETMSEGSKDETKDDCDKDGVMNVKRKKDLPDNSSTEAKRQRFGHREEPFLFFTETDPLWPSIRDFFKVKATFRADQLMYRCEAGSRRRLYFVSEGIKDLVTCNSDRVKFINMGVKVFGRSSSPLVPQCEFRLAQEGLESVSALFEGRRVTVCRDDIVTILTNENPLFTTLTQPMQDQLNDISAGSVMFVFKPTEMEPRPNCEIILCGWRGKMSVRPFLSQNDIHHYLRLFDAPIPALNTTKKFSENKSRTSDETKESTEHEMTAVTTEEETAPQEGTAVKAEDEMTHKEGTADTLDENT